MPIRTCVVCGCRKHKSILLRVALDPRTKTVVVDRHQRLQGRGAYVCPDCLPRLRFTRRIQKAFRNEAKGLAQDILP